MQASVWFNYLGSRKRFWYAASLNTVVSGLHPDIARNVSKHLYVPDERGIRVIDVASCQHCIGIAWWTIVSDAPLWPLQGIVLTLLFTPEPLRVPLLELDRRYAYHTAGKVYHGGRLSSTFCDNLVYCSSLICPE